MRAAIACRDIHRLRTVASRQNPTVRRFRALAAIPDRDGTRVLLDGSHLVADARDAGIAFEVVAVASSRLATDSEEARLARMLEEGGVDVAAVPDSLFATLSPVKSPSGIVAIGRRTPADATRIYRHVQALIVAAVDVQEPGNVGALLRVAEAGGATGALLCGSSANPFSWKALRGSMGSALRVPTASGLDVVDALDRLQEASVRAIAAVPRHGQDPDRIDWSGRVALLLGGEGPGLPDAVASRCDLAVSIPMQEPVESLNVATAGAILIYAARRQRARDASHVELTF